MQNLKFRRHPLQVFCQQIPHFWQICDGNIFPSIFEQFFTSPNWNFQIWIKNEQKLGLYFYKFWNSLFPLLSPQCNVGQCLVLVQTHDIDYQKRKVCEWPTYIPIANFVQKGTSPKKQTNPRQQHCLYMQHLTIASIRAKT